ncbi:hypothetical protein [Fodinibius sp.]|uniref:hypothetical protein n=1 Tax=Fodinibius sp. TaxID=1872440 RepID=UPI002ACE3B5A|nr:hypothetical protein [Fodinibius sp.]MDZ7658739.1 hypothetical protein [Fodinibius sp.]
MIRITLLSSFLLFFSTFLIGSENSSPVSFAITDELVPSKLDVHFARNVTILKSNAFLADLSRQAITINLSNMESRVKSNWTVVGVPEEQEQFWGKKNLQIIPMLLLQDKEPKQYQSSNIFHIPVLLVSSL